MASPIEPTPPLAPEDAARLRRQMEHVATRAEIARRKRAARRFRERVTRPLHRR